MFNLLSLIIKKERCKTMNAFDVVSLGEVLCRFSPSNGERLSQSDNLKRQIGGAELNVVSALSNVGCRSAIITKIPNNENGIFVKNSIRSFGVSDDLLVYDDPDARLGIYFSEGGAYPRKPTVIYDRRNAAFCTLQIDDIPSAAFNNAKVFHTTGITLALKENIRDNTIKILKKFKENGSKISFDVNFRSKLWTESLARETILDILPYIDIFFCSEETFRKTFQQTGSLEDIMRNFSQKFNISVIASTKRTVHSPKVHSFTSYIYDAKQDKIFTEQPYENIEVIDRIGSGDAYIAGVLYGLLQNNWSCEKALQYGNAFSVLKNTVPGDILCSNLNEINSVIDAHNGKGSLSEMNR